MAKPNNSMAKANNNKKGAYNPSFGFWPTKKGTGFSVQITDQLLGTLANAKNGGRLYLSAVEAKKLEENDKLPHYRVTIFPPDEERKENAETL